jgi:UDP-N-acetylmuramyl pentapeptide phosphotransferase/UDP-N-acetylglucosamine-1-phosphate transferase
MNRNEIYLLSFIVLVALVWHVLVFYLAPKLSLIKPNYAKEPIISSYGIISFAYIAATVGVLMLLGYAPMREGKLYLSVMAAMWALGILDDIFGSREVGGFKGHFKKLIYERKLTTGAVKAIGGGIVGIVAGWFISDGEIIRWIPAALIIPLSANILNLVDLRPGRAVAVFFLGLGVTYIGAHGGLAAPSIVGAIAIVTAAWGIVDSRGRAMMGDSGSNALGAALGVTIALNTGLIFQIVAIVVIIAIHLYSEKHSISKLIDGNFVLRAIDSRLGVR